MNHLIHRHYVRISILVAIILSLVTFGWLIHPSTPATIQQPYTPTSMMTPAPAVTHVQVITKTKIVTKTVNVPGPVRTVYVSRAKVRTAPAPSGSGVVSLGYMLQRMGFNVSEHPLFGGVTPGAHAVNSQHYTGNAIDVNWYGGDEFGHINDIVKYAAIYNVTYIWQAPGHYDHIHFGNPR